MTDLSVLKEASEIIRTWPMNLAVGHLRQCADELYEAYDVLKITCTRNAVTRFVAAFNRTLLAIEMVRGNEPPSPRGGVLEVPAQDAMGC